MKNILITSAGRRVSLVKIFQQTLKLYNPEGKVFVTEMEPALSSAAHVADGFIKVPKVTDKNYINILKSICKDYKISIVVPTIDTELHILADAKEQFLKENILIAVSSKKVCDIFYLKSRTENFFSKNNFLTPKIIKDIKNCNYPIFAKLDNSSCSIGAQIVYLPEIANILSKSNNYIFQEFIKGDEYTVDVFVDRAGQIISIVPRLRLEVRAGEVSKGKTVKDKTIINEVKKLCSVLKGAYGCLTIQVFKSNDNLYFIEINPRFGGGYPLSFHAGANFAEYLIKDYLMEKLEYSESWKNNTLMLRYDGEVIINDSGI